MNISPVRHRAAFGIHVLSPEYLQQAVGHGLNNYKDTKPQKSSLLVLDIVHRLEIQSVMLVFSTSFVNYCPSNLSG